MTLPTAAATPASSAPASANLTVQDILDHLPDDVVAGALIRRDGVGATAGPVTADAYARIGSVTKAFTNTVVLQLVAEHRIGLDTPARRYVPQVLSEAYNRVTVRQLLDHTSGLQSPYPWAEGGMISTAANVKSAADNTNCVGQRPATASAGSCATSSQLPAPSSQLPAPKRRVHVGQDRFPPRLGQRVLRYPRPPTPRGVLPEPDGDRQ
ncbi:serine hydrolase domain-containing protein [Streptomyces sp. NRRL B-3648]|uniref:serine hydrolase domain-containing protein n=1 Tax=Streptomyces sp. NRRL B-3648 TaxID=1519493 RepID=UPI000A6BD80A|nr:serine hydrolase domain-containing protein [Streptomyces sp. NRRL B-3648]